MGNKETVDKLAIAARFISEAIDVSGNRLGKVNMERLRDIDNILDELIMDLED